MVHINPAQLAAYIKSQPPYSGCKGSVVRLRVTDFMTYHYVELRAGAHVNLILGPNGTGKSTIVCAICLGLAGKPKILGRAIALREYIRHGAKSATIEIELFNPDGLNYVIRRHIKDTSASTVTQWYLQGKRAQPSQIEDLTSSLNIQLDNLCQFLPQDRVSDFVAMDSFSLLQNTQKALGNDTLYMRHENLIHLTVSLQEVEKKINSHSSTLISVQQYTKRLEKDVENYKDREALKLKITELTSKKAWMSYLKARDGFVRLNSELEAVKVLKKQEEAKLAPLKKSLEFLETKMAKYRVDLNRHRNANGSLINGVKRKVEEEFDRVEALVSEEQAKYSEQERSEKDRMTRLKNVYTKIHGYEKQLEEIRMKGDMDDAKLNRQCAELDGEIRKYDDQILEINGLDERDESERRLLLNRIRKAESELSRMDDLRVSRMKYLELEQPDVYEAVQFYSRPENRARFKGEIHEPMILHIAVNDLKYGRVLERHVGFAEMNGFFCEDRDDVEVMLKLNSQRGKRVSVTHYEGPRSGNFERPGCPYQPDFMDVWGFKKVLLDLVEGPDYYLSYLFDRFHLEKVLIGSEHSERMFQEIGEKTSLHLFYTERSSFQIRQSNYSKSKVLSYSGLPLARVMTTEINAQEKQRLHESVVQWKALDRKLEAQVRTRGATKVELEKERQDKEDEIRDIKARVEYRKTLQCRLETAKKQLSALEREKKDLDSLKKSTELAIMTHRQKLANVADFIARETNKISAGGVKPIVLRRMTSLIQTRIISRQTELDQMTGEVKQCEAQIRTLTPQVEQSALEAEINKKDAIAKANGITEPPQDVLSGELSEKDVDKDLNQANVQLRFVMETDPSIVRDYQDKVRQIKELQKDKDKEEKDLVIIKENIKKEKEAWLTPLTELIGTVNKNFGRFFSNMGCAGEVQLHKGEDENDFSKYGIKILVKFRSSENLSELGGSKGCALQSGGERVISTALYILALQELTTVPFRVIDEINQGMDATNEARFFNLLCSLARGANTPQYFLLTPKLLPPVEYPDNVDFHFIMSGPHVNVPLAGHSTAGSSDDDGEGED